MKLSINNLGEGLNMKLKMSLTENAYDFLNASLKYFHEADEYGNHNKFLSNRDKHSKWKFAIINIIQAMELLFKEILKREHPILIYENIDNGYTSNNKTVSLSLALNRMVTILNLDIDNSDITKIKKVINLRNEMMHYKFHLSSEEAKQKYGMIYKFIKNFHQEYLNEDISKRINKDLEYVEGNLLYFIDNLVPYRGSEVHKEELSELKKKIKKNKEKEYYIINNKKYKRIKYGDEPKHSNYHALLVEKENRTYLDNPICNDCFAKKGEFHLPGCDLEICPKCYGQAIRCDCDFEEED